MNLIHLLLVVFIVLCIIGVIMWGINKVAVIPEVVKIVVYVIVAVLLLLWLLSFVNGNSFALK